MLLLILAGNSMSNNMIVRAGVGHNTEMLFLVMSCYALLFPTTMGHNMLCLVMSTPMLFPLYYKIAAPLGHVMTNTGTE